MPQVNKLKRIVIASVLKPVDEPRMFERLGRSIGNTSGAEVHILGSPPAGHPEIPQKVFLHPIASQAFARLSFKRLLIPVVIFKKIRRLQPQLIIITTHELLFTALLLKWLSGSKIIYDVQENYYRNIRYTNVFPFGIRHALALWVRCKEMFCARFIDHFMLAEAGYVSELRFARPSLTLQNKLPADLIQRYRKSGQAQYHKLLFTGTLAETTGVFKAIELADGLYKLDASISLTIVGHCPLASDWQRLHQLQASLPFVRLKIDRHPVAHKVILSEIQQADFGIIWYPDNPATQSSRPTKLFEYLGLNLPILIRHNRESQDLVQQYEAGLMLNEPIHYPELISLMSAFRINPVTHDWSWDSEFQTAKPVLSNYLT